MVTFIRNDLKTEVTSNMYRVERIRVWRGREQMGIEKKDGFARPVFFFFLIRGGGGGRGGGVWGEIEPNGLSVWQESRSKYLYLRKQMLPQGMVIVRALLQD